MAVIIVSNETFAYALPSCAHTSDRNRKSFSASLPTQAQQMKVKYVNMKIAWRQVHLDPVIWWCTNKTLRTVKTRTVKNLHHSYLGGACLFTSVVVAKDAKNAERQSAAGMLFCPGNIS